VVQESSYPRYLPPPATACFAPPIPTLLVRRWWFDGLDEMGLFDHSHSLQIEKSKRRSSFLLSLRSSCLLVPLYRVQGFTEEDAATTIIRERRPRETEVNGTGRAGQRREKRYHPYKHCCSDFSLTETRRFALVELSPWVCNNRRGIRAS